MLHSSFRQGLLSFSMFFFFNDTATTEIYTLSLTRRSSDLRGKYQDVILPLTVLRRLDCVLAPTKDTVLRRRAELKGRGEDLDGALRKASGVSTLPLSSADPQSTRLNSSHQLISYAVFLLKK